MARKLLVCSVIVAFLAAALLGVQADTQDVMGGILKYAEKFLNDIMQRVKDVISKAQQFIDDVKQKIRQEEDKLLNQIPDPLGQLLKGIVNRMREAQEKKSELRANMTECVTKEAKPAFEIVNATMKELRTCVEGSTSNIKSTIADFEDLIKQAMNLVISVPKELMPCIKFPPTSETWSCVTGKVQDLSSKGLLLASSLISDMGTIGREVPEIIKTVIACGVEERFEAEKKLGEIFENIGNCEKNVVNNST